MSETRWCCRCGRPDRDSALDAMRQRIPGSAGWMSAVTSWSPEPCECRQPDWDLEDELRSAGETP